MKKCFAFFRLIRWLNLLIIVLTQVALRYGIVQPMARAYGFEPVLTLTDFILLCLSTVLIAAAGYAINDYFDLRVDRINKPERQIVGKLITRRSAMTWHMFLSGAGILCGAYVSWHNGLTEYALIHVFAAISLWFYSTYFKREFITGNLIIALMAALVPFVPGLFDVSLLNNNYAEAMAINKLNFNQIAFWVIGYSIFAFLLSLSREIIKDIEDMKGDEIIGSHSIAVRLGAKTSARMAAGLYLLVLALVVIVHLTYIPDYITTVYITVLFFVPLLISAIYLLTAKEKSHYHKASNWNKVAMLSGICYAGVAWYQFCRFINGWPC